ncbi:hypothetical protein ONS96_005983 [Cadophora gregata f. sp. sojae]|nr:hypothetical protein ONS96_005983 [Cadophora gregata f. sp. sojae]
MIVGTRKEVSSSSPTHKRVLASLEKTPPDPSKMSAPTTTKASPATAPRHHAAPTNGTLVKSSFTTPRKGTSGTSESPKSDTQEKKKKVTIAKYVEFEGDGDYENAEGDHEGHEEGYEGDQEAYEDEEGDDEAWEGHEQYSDEDYESEESEGWNVFDPWFLWNDLDGSRMAANFKRFHALNRDMAPERLRKKINPCPYDVPYVIKKEASCPMLFEDFLELPDNIREKIWEYALPQESRVLVIYQHSGAYVKCAGPDVFATQGFGGRRPVLLRVNHEAREIAKRFYKLAFGAVDGKPKYFNFALDALHLWGVDHDFVDRMPFIKDDLGKVQKLAIHGAGLLGDEDQYARLQHLTSLKILLIEKPSDRVDIMVRDDFHNKFNHATKQLFAELSIRRAQATTSSSTELENENHDYDMQIEGVETGWATSATISEHTLEAATSGGIVDEMPDVETLIDHQAIADMSTDVDMLIDEAMTDISSADAFPVTPASLFKELITTELVIDFRTFMYTCTKTKKIVEGTGVSMADGQGGQSGLPDNINMGLDNDSDTMIAVPQTPEKAGTDGKPGAAAFANNKADGSSDILILDNQSSTPADSAIVLDDSEKAAFGVQKANSKKMERLVDFGLFVVVWEKAEDILEIAIMPSRWPKRVNKTKKFWKWNFAKRRADDIWGTGVYSNQVPHDYGHQFQPANEVPALPPSPRSAAARVEATKGLRARRLKEATENPHLCCACADRVNQAPNNNEPPVGPLQGSDGDYLAVGHLAPIEVKTAVNSINFNAANPNPTQYISPYTIPRTTNAYKTFSSTANNAATFPHRPASYQSPYALLASGHYTHTAPDPTRYVSPYGNPTAGITGGSFGVIRLGNAGRSGSMGGSSNGGNRGPIAGPIPTPRYTAKTANNTGGGKAYYVNFYSTAESGDRGEVAVTASSSTPHGAPDRTGLGGFANDGPGSARGSAHHDASALSDGDTTDDEIS